MLRSSIVRNKALSAALSPDNDNPGGRTKSFIFHHSSRNCFDHSEFRNKNTPLLYPPPLSLTTIKSLVGSAGKKSSIRTLEFIMTVSASIHNTQSQGLLLFVGSSSSPSFISNNACTARILLHAGGRDRS